MANMHSCPSSEQNRIRMVDVFGKKIAVKGYICSRDGVNYPQKGKETRLQLSVLPHSYCPAACPFCIMPDTSEHKRIDLKKFERVMRRLNEDNLVRGVKITGGEPFEEFELFRETVDILFDVFGKNLELSVSTNGRWLSRMHELKNLTNIETFHISRHHYDDDINRMLFGGADVPSGSELREVLHSVTFPDIFVINCMLLRDYINSPEEARRFLDFAIGLGAPKVGFMCCTPVNAFAREQAIRFESVLCSGDPSLLFTQGFFDYEYCHCRDGVYVSDDGRLIEFYGRDTSDSQPGYCRGLVYDSDNYLKDGFNGNIIC